MTQKQTVKRHLEDFGKLTSMYAFSNYSITRLAEYIRQLRVEGMSIHSEPTTRVNRFGKSVTFSTYELVKADENGQMMLL